MSAEIIFLCTAKFYEAIVMSIRPFLPLLATVIVIAVNAAANIVPINGMNTGELSDLYPTGFTPPGYVFSIWSVIYLGLLAFGVAAWRGAPNLRARITEIQTPFLINAVGNAAWIFVWHYRLIAVSVAVMLVILATLIVIFTRLQRLPSPSLTEFLCVDGVFSIYFGWITSATLINISALFFDVSWYPFGMSMDQWALATVCVATGIYVWVGTLSRSAAYCAVFVWAAIGIYRGEPTVTEPVRIAALSGAIAVATCLTWAIISRPQRAQNTG
ncbi:MAG: tryptophan-rich sensory protein [Gammaproteobacteria bacterium]|nr:tryptophan-rich sensory protein [Gammaproteobacteria bacterium]